MGFEPIKDIVFRKKNVERVLKIEIALVIEISKIVYKIGPIELY